jgi:phosphoribosylformylglycinamidine cyclo-ligase
MYNIFNMGIGMVIAAAPEDVPNLISHLEEQGEAVYKIGIVKSGEGIEIGDFL